MFFKRQFNAGTHTHIFRSIALSSRFNDNAVSLLGNSNRHLKRKEKKGRWHSKKTPKLFCFCFFCCFLFRKQKEKDDVRNQRLVIRCCFYLSVLLCVFLNLFKQTKHLLQQISEIKYPFVSGGIQTHGLLIKCPPPTKQNKLSNESIYNYNRMYFEMSMKTCRHKHQQNKSEFVELDLASITILI